MIKVNTCSFDSVIESQFLTAQTDYQIAIEKLYPLINRLHIQRKIQTETFYKRLESDIKIGCIMPPLTLAFVDDNDMNHKTVDEYEKYVNDNIGKSFVLDGIQRLNTLKRVFDQKELTLTKSIYLNIIICKSRDNILYRMITLNNGQKPMTARHQIEILASNIYDFKGLGINIVSEKESEGKKIRNAFAQSDIVSAYIAFLSNTTSLESNKIIDQKMDELIARQIIDSNITTDKLEFGEFIQEIARLCNEDFLYKWFKNLNNLLGFCVGAKKSLPQIRQTSLADFTQLIQSFEDAFKAFDISKIKLGRERRKLTQFLFEHFSDLESSSADDLLITFNELD
jgi:hypothetical protein